MPLRVCEKSTYSKRKQLPILGLETIYLVSKDYWYRALTYLAVNEKGNDLHCSYYQTLKAGLVSHTTRKINEH